MQDFNYHTHTKRCGHATGEDIEYIEAAIKAGFKVIGISDHIPWEGFDLEKDRMPFSQLEEYLSTINELKEVYKDKIEIRIGFEFECMPNHIDYLKEIQSKTDYLIVGQHYTKDVIHGIELGCTSEDVKVFADNIIFALDNKLTRYVAHVDYFLLGKDDFNESDKQEIRRICEAVLRNDAYIEMNIKGSKYGKKEYEGHMQYIYIHMKMYFALLLSTIVR